MNSRPRLIYSLPALLLTLSCGVAGERRNVQFEHRWPAAGIRQIDVHEVSGAISIEPSATDQITLIARVRSREEPKRNQEYQGYFQTAVDGDTLVIGRRKHRVTISFPLFDADDTRIDYELRVPPAVALDLQTVNGRITTRGIDGQTHATTVNGVVNIETSGMNEVEANAVNGRIEARFLKDFHGATFKTVNGRVVATLPPTASFVGDFTQVNGDVEAAFPLNIHSHPGSRRVSGEVNGGRYSLRITTVNGDIKIDNGAR